MLISEPAPPAPLDNQRLGFSECLDYALSDTQLPHSISTSTKELRICPESISFSAELSLSQGAKEDLFQVRAKMKLLVLVP